jgi:hypothetical protein
MKTRDLKMRAYLSESAIYVARPVRHLLGIFHRATKLGGEVPSMFSEAQEMRRKAQTKHIFMDC